MASTIAAPGLTTGRAPFVEAGSPGAIAAIGSGLLRELADGGLADVAQ